MGITIYSTPTCPKCEEIKKTLEGDGIEFEEVDMSTPAGMTDLRVHEVFVLTAPVVRIGDQFLVLTG